MRKGILVKNTTEKEGEEKEGVLKMHNALQWKQMVVGLKQKLLKHTDSNSGCRYFMSDTFFFI